MNFRVYRSFEALNPLASEWNRLLEQSAIHVPFLRYEYQEIWWRNRGGGEWPAAELAVVAGYEGERLVGLAPLFFTPNHEGRPALMLLGSIEISDYLDLLVEPTALEPFVHGLLPFLAGAEAGLPAWQALDWYNVLDDSPTLPALRAAAAGLAWSYQQEVYQHAPYIALPGDWDAYLAGIDKKQRHEIRRKMRRAEEGEVQVAWCTADDPARLDEDIEAFFRLMANDPQKASFLTEPMRVQMRETIRCAFEAGCLQLAFLTVDGAPAAAYLSFDYLNRIWVYNSGMDNTYREVSPGWVLLGYLLRWANENGRSEFDFLRGDEDYKYRFGGQDRTVLRVQVSR